MQIILRAGTCKNDQLNEGNHEYGGKQVTIDGLIIQAEIESILLKYRCSLSVCVSVDCTPHFLACKNHVIISTAQLERV